MPNNRTHAYFERKPSEWDILGFLDEYNTHPFELDKSLDEYLKSLEIINSQQGGRQRKASLLLDRYRKASRPDYHLARKWDNDRRLNKPGGHSIIIQNSTLTGNSLTNVNNSLTPKRSGEHLESENEDSDEYEDESSEYNPSSTEESGEDVVVAHKRRRRNIRVTLEAATSDNIRDGPSIQKTEIEINEENEDDDVQPRNMDPLIDGNTTPPPSSPPKEVITPRKPNLDASFGDHIVLGERGRVVQVDPAVKSWLTNVLLSNKETFKSALDGGPCSEFAEVCKFALTDFFLMTRRGCLDQDIGERKYIAENIVPMFKGIAAIYNNVTFDWIEAELCCIRSVKVMFPKSDIMVHKADGIVKSRVNQKETVFIEVSGGPVNPDAKHVREDTEKLIREGVFGLVAILRDHLTKPLEKCMQVRTFLLQVIADRMTLSEVGLSDIKHKYVVSEICSAQIPFAFDDAPKFMQIFNLLHTLVEKLRGQTELLKRLTLADDAIAASVRESLWVPTHNAEWKESEASPVF